MDCQIGFMCEGGRCVEDPCNAITCPSGAECHRGRCGDGDGTGVGGDAPQDAGVDGSISGSSPAGDDCGCRVGAQQGDRPWAFVLGFIALLGLRRRRR